jgi:hypothetical protein
MKIVLDRRSCNCWEPARESHLAGISRDEITLWIVQSKSLTTVGRRPSS